VKVRNLAITSLQCIPLERHKWKIRNRCLGRVNSPPPSNINWDKFWKTSARIVSLSSLEKHHGIMILGRTILDGRFKANSIGTVYFLALLLAPFYGHGNP